MDFPDSHSVFLRRWLNFQTTFCKNITVVGKFLLVSLKQSHHYEEVRCRTPFRSQSLRVCLASLVRLTWKVFEMGRK